MIKSTAYRLFILFALFGLLTLTVPRAAQAAGFVQNESSYWNMGTLPLPSNGNGNIEHCTLESGNLKMPNNVVGFNVYTPPSYASSSQSYPVIYLLHGINGNEYNYFSYFNDSTFFNSGSGSLPSLIDNGLTDEAIIVFVNGGAMSFYQDWNDNFTYGVDYNYGPSSSFPIMTESIIMEDVIPFIDANFRTIANRNGRAVEGFSMGGGGAMKLALEYSDQFCSTIAYSGGTYEEYTGSPAINPYSGTEHDEEHKASVIATNNASSILANGLKIRMVDGDGAAGQGGGSAGLSTLLDTLGIPYEYVPSQAGVINHDWGQYHQATGLYGLNFHFQCFADATSSAPAPIILGSVDEFTYIPFAKKPPQPVSSGSCN